MLLKRTEQEKVAEMKVVSNMDSSDIPISMLSWSPGDLAKALGFDSYTGSDQDMTQLMNMCMAVSENEVLENAPRLHRLHIIYTAMVFLGGYR
jgi:hypothetical protein